jgi:ATP-binding cassette subfamily B protein
VLRHVSFSVPAGGTLGVVGATGSGKSTLLDLIPRLHDPQEGEILLDGVPLTRFDPADLRRAIGMVPQDPFLFSETIEENIGLGVEDLALAREDPDEAVLEAARVAQLHDSIVSFPKGYATLLGERGINLSGGQKQRLALARALARRPRIVLLDDALSAVDTHTEAEILRGLRGALAGRTAVIASHRVSAVRDANQVIVLDEGRVVETGTHAVLIAAGGRYATLLQRQQLEESLDDDGAEPVLESATNGVTASTGSDGDAR